MCFHTFLSFQTLRHIFFCLRLSKLSNYKKMKKNIKLHLAHYLKRCCCFPRLSKNGPFTKFVGSFDFCSCPLFVWYFKGRGLFFCGCVRSFLFVGWNNIFSSKKKRKENIALFRVVNHISHNITQGRLHLVCFFEKNVVSHHVTEKLLAVDGSLFF